MLDFGTHRFAAGLGRARWAGFGLFLTLCLVFLMFAAIGCKQEKAEEAPLPPPAEAPVLAEPPAEAQPEAASTGEIQATGQDSGLPSAKAASTGRKIILSFMLSVEVKDAMATFEALDRLAVQAGAYVIKSTKDRRDDGTLKGSVTYRVPPGFLDGFLFKIRRLGKILGETSSGDDVTDQYVDLEARIRNAKATEEEVLKILHERTGKLLDVLEVTREVGRIRGEIEEMEARKRNIELLTATSSVTVDISEPEPDGMTEKVKSPFKPIWEAVKSAFNEGMVLLSGSLHFLIVTFFALLPWALFAAIIIIIWAKAKKRGAGNRVPAQGSGPAIRTPMITPARVRRPQTGTMEQADDDTGDWTPGDDNPTGK